MARYSYHASSKDGRAMTGTVVAASEEAAYERLKDAGLFVSALQAQRTQNVSVNLEDLPILKPLVRLITGGRVGARQLTLFTRQFASLLSAGIPVRRSLAILGGQSNSTNLRDALQSVSADIDDGLPLCEAFERQPAVFSPLFVSMVRVGEQSGTLETVLRRLALDMERRQSLKGKVRSAMVYPCFLLFASTAILGLVLTFIVPRFQDIYDQLGQQLPLPTQLLVFGSDALLHHGPLVLLTLFVCATFFMAGIRTKRGRYLFDRIALLIPVFGPLVQMSAVARFSRVLSTTFESGIPVLQAFDLVAGTAGNEVVARAVKRVQVDVREGESIAAAIAREPVFPPMVTQMIAVGEESGEIDPMLSRCADIFEEDTDAMVKGLTSILEPAMIIILGVFIGFVVVALYLPMWKLISTMGT